MKRAVAILLLVAPFAGAASADTKKPASIIVMGDTQVYSMFPPRNLIGVQTEWIKANLAAENIVFVSHVGDVTEHGSRKEWAAAAAGFATLDGPGPHGVVPYSVTMGNHDPGGPGPFGPDRFAKYAVAEGGWYGGSTANGLNHYQYFTAGGIKFLHLNLRWKRSDADMKWAQDILDANPGMPTILTTHDFLDARMGADGPNSYDDEAPRLWRTVIDPNPQIFLVLCGHNWPNFNLLLTNRHGGKVLAVMTNFQEQDNGGNGWLQQLTFDVARNQIRSRVYSPTLDAEQHDRYADWAVEATFSSDRVVIGERLGAPVRTWTGAAGDGRWQTAGNWTDDVVPADGDAIRVYQNAAAIESVNDLPAGMTVSDITLEIFSKRRAESSLRLSGNPLVLSGWLRDNHNSGHPGSVTVDLPIRLDGACGITTFRAFTITAPISGSGSLTVLGTGPTAHGSSTIVLAGTNSFTGGLTIIGGGVSVADGSGLGAGPVAFRGTGQVLAVTGSSAVIDNEIVLPVVAGELHQNSRSVTLKVPATSTVTLAGSIGGGSPALDWILQGGTIVVAGTSAHAGRTTIRSGVVLVDGSLAGGAVSVADGATLGGSGRIRGPVTVAGTLAPTGTLTIENQAACSGRLAFDLGATSDRIEVMGDLSLTGTLDVTAAEGFGPGTYTLATCTGRLSVGALAIGRAPDGVVCALDTTEAGHVKLVVTNK